VDEMEIYEVEGDEHIKEMVNILRKAARELNDAVKILRDYPKIASEHAVKAKAYENQKIEKAYIWPWQTCLRGRIPLICSRCVRFIAISAMPPTVGMKPPISFQVS